MQIHLSRNGQAFGVHDADAVKAGLRGGVFLPTDLAWHEGAPGWLPLLQMPGFVESAPPPVAPPVPPPVPVPPAIPPASPMPAPASYQPQVQSQFTPQAPPSYPLPQTLAPGQYAPPPDPRQGGRRGSRWWIWLIATAIPVLVGGFFYIKSEMYYRRRAQEASDSMEARWAYERDHPGVHLLGDPNSSSTSTATPAPDAGNNPAVLQAPALLQAYRKNAAAADAQYKGKPFTVSGEVVSAGTTPTGEVFMLLEADPAAGDRISCDFPVSAKGTVSALRKGQTVTVRGTGGVYQYGSVELKDCQLVR